MMWVRTNTSRWLMQQTSTSRYNSSNMITHYLYEQFFRTRKEWNLWENNTYGNNGHKFHGTEIHPMKKIFHRFPGCHPTGHLLEEPTNDNLSSNLPFHALFVCLLHSTAETTFHPAQKYPVLSHFQLDASSSQIPVPEKWQVKALKTKLWACCNDTTQNTTITYKFSTKFPLTTLIHMVMKLGLLY